MNVRRAFRKPEPIDVMRDHILTLRDVYAQPDTYLRYEDMSWLLILYRLPLQSRILYSGQ